MLKNRLKWMRLKGSQGDERESVIYNQRTGRGKMGEGGASWGDQAGAVVVSES